MSSQSRETAIVINARLASSRLPQKLVRPFGDTTLLDIALSKLRSISAKEKYLAAGDEEIIEVYKKYENDIGLLLRNKEAVASGEHPHEVSFAHYKDTKSKFIMIMNPCMPFTKVETYEKAMYFFKENKDIKTLTSVTKDHNIFMDKRGVPINLPDINHISTNTTDPVFRMAHIFHIIDRDAFFENGKFWDYSPKNPSMFEVPKEETFDVDDPVDFNICFSLYASNFSSGT